MRYVVAAVILLVLGDLASAQATQQSLELRVTLVEVPALVVDRSNTTIAMLYANVLVEDAQLNEAKKILDAIPSSAVTDPTAMMNIGILLLNKNKPVDALLYFDRAMSIDPKRGEIYYYRALSHVQLDRRAAAKKDLETFIELSPDAGEVAEAREMLKALK